jgi:hypothetical protein
MKKHTQTALLISLLGISLGSQPLLAMNGPANSNNVTAPANNFPPVAPGGKIDFNNIPPMSPEELTKWEEDVTKEIDQYVSTLSPEDQAQFHKEVEELTNVMSKMSPDELVKFIDTMLTEEGQQPTMPLPAQEPTTPQPEVEEKTVTPEKTPELPAKSADAALALIDDLIMHIERFLRKSNMIPELPGNIEQWVSKNKIKEWKNNLTWEILKGDIEALNKQLNRLKDRDPKTKNYLYLSKLIEQESLYNNLIHVKQALARHEPSVEAPAFGLGNVTPKSHEAIKQVLTTLSEAIYTLHVPTDINKVLGTSEAREKELKAEEEKARKQAIEHSKRPQVEGAKRETPMPQPSTGGYRGGEQPGYPSYSGNYPYSGGGYSYPESSYYGPNAYANKPGTTPGKPGQGGSGTPGKEAEQGGKKKGAEETKAAEVKLDDTGKGLVTKIDKALEKFADNYDNSPLQNIYAQLAGGATMDSKLQEAINKAQSSINNALDLTKKLKTRGRTNQSPQAAIRDALRDVALPYNKRINTLIKQIGTLKTTQGVIVPPAVDTLYTALTDFSKEVGSASDKGESMPAGMPIKPTTAAPELAEETKGAPTKAAPEKTEKRAEVKHTPFDRAKRKLDETILDAETDLNDPKIKGISKHIMGIDTPDIETAKAVKVAFDDCKLIVTKARSLNSVLSKLPAAEQKQHRLAMRKEYDEYHKLFAERIKELSDLVDKDLKKPVELGKGYAFFGKAMTDEMIDKEHPAHVAKANELKALREKFGKEFGTVISLSDLINAIKAADKALKDI